MNIDIDPKMRKWSICPNMYFDNYNDRGFVIKILIDLPEILISDKDDKLDNDDKVLNLIKE